MSTEQLIDREAHARLLQEGERRRQERALEMVERNDRRRTKQDGSAIDTEFVAKLEAKTQAVLERRKRLDAYVRGLKIKTEKCEKHPGELMGLDVDQMSRDSKGEEWVLRFKPCQKCAIEARSEWLKRVGVPGDMLHATLDNWQAHNQAEKGNVFLCKKFVQHAQGFLVIHNAAGSESKFGIGKTHLAIGILREIGSGRFVTQSSMMVKVRRRYSDRYAEDIVDALCRARCVVLDEIGVGPGGDDELPTLYTILNHRYNEKLPTVLTMNMDMTGLYEYLGGRLESRLRAAIWKVIEVAGTDQRGRQ
jgi:DNA replication protein DnaC